MKTSALDPMIHHPERLRVVATLAALPDSDAVTITRLRDMVGLPSASLTTRVRELDSAGYLQLTAARGRASVALTRDGRAALDGYATALTRQRRAPAPGLRAGDADRDAAAAALVEHFAQGRLTLEELNTRLDATLTAVTYGELSEATWDLPPGSPPA